LHDLHRTPTACAAIACRRDDLRSKRVIVLLAGIILLSIADLVVTLVHLRTIGMAEANPIAAWLIRSTQSPWVLMAYKALTVGICVSVLYRFRRCATGEIASWIGVLILAGMALLWSCYSSALESPAEVLLAQAEQGEQWLYLD